MACADGELRGIGELLSVGDAPRVEPAPALLITWGVLRNPSGFQNLAPRGKTGGTAALSAEGKKT